MVQVKNIDNPADWPTQVDLLDYLTAKAPSELDQRFWAFHRDNPHVFEKIVELATQAKQAGRTKIGMKSIMERLRWDYLMDNKTSDFKLNNSYTSRYVRLLEERRPDLGILFETRSIRS